MAVTKSSKPAVKKKAAPTRRAPAIQKKYTKTEILNEIAQNTSLSKKDVSSVLDELAVVIERHIRSALLVNSRYPAW